MEQNLQGRRRAFLKQVARAGVAGPFFVRNLLSAPPNSTVRLASFGADNMAWATLDGIARHAKVKVVCAAEVDSSRLTKLKNKFPEARAYQDWREMLRKERHNLDAVCVGTPDHMHAPTVMSSMQLGLHVYGQKPLAHDIFECRKLMEMAARKKLVTQMGIQVHSAKEYKTAVALVHAGVIGKVREAHSWSNKKWGDPDLVPDRSDPVPSSLNWDHWIGTAALRPYLANGYYHPGNWRKRQDFGTATFGDMGCHIFDPVFEAVQLTAPISVRSEGPAPGQHNWALNSIIHYVFPGTPMTEGKTVNVSWYDGDERPPQEIQSLLGTRQLPSQGSILVGTKGSMLLPHVAMPVLLPEQQFDGFTPPTEEAANHYFQFVEAILGNGKTTTGFEYSAPLTESVLLGPIATRFPRTTLEWNAKKMHFRNSTEATGFVKRNYRAGWTVKGLS
jgi:Oxidoreductase family, NAD-binding Rossmann fold/Oxidoreductase family, C-terminal alpha/beta domain